MSAPSRTGLISSTWGVQETKVEFKSMFINSNCEMKVLLGGQRKDVSAQLKSPKRPAVKHRLSLNNNIPSFAFWPCFWLLLSSSRLVLNLPAQPRPRNLIYQGRHRAATTSAAVHKPETIAYTQNMQNIKTDYRILQRPSLHPVRPLKNQNGELDCKLLFRLGQRVAHAVRDDLTQIKS